MEAFASFHSMLKVVTEFGLVGVILLMWWYDNRQMRRLQSDHKAEMETMLMTYRADVAEMRRMYESNVELVRGYDSVSRDLKDIVVTNTQAVTRVCDSIEKNQFCPIVRREQGP